MPGKEKIWCFVVPKVTEVDTQTYMFPIGIAYVCAYLKKTGRKVITLNLNYKSENIEDVLRKTIKQNDVEVVATGGLTAQYKQIREIFNAIENINKNITKICGGYNHF